MGKPRRSELWSSHTDTIHPPAAGSPFGSTHGMPMRISCGRCTVHRLPVELEYDKPRGRYFRRCIDRETCATARGGKS